MRSMVEGPTLATIHNEPQCCVQVLQDIACSYAQGLKSKMAKHRIPSLVTLRAIAHGVSFTVDFNRHTAIQTGEVQDVAAYRKLPSES